MTDRAASEVLSFALVFSLVVTSVAIVSVSGLNSLERARDAEQLNNAERAFDVLADNMADIYQRGAPSRATEVSLGGAQLVLQENVTVNVTAVDSGGADVTVEREVRSIVYQGARDRKLVYEAGAVFRVNRDGGLVVQDPPFMVGADRAFLSVVAHQSGNVESAGGSTVLLRATERTRTVPVADTNGTYEYVYLNVTSPRADRWDDYLSRTTMTAHRSGTDADGDRFVTYRVAAPESLFVVATDVAVTIDR